MEIINCAGFALEISDNEIQLSKYQLDGKRGGYSLYINSTNTEYALVVGNCSHKEDVKVFFENLQQIGIEVFNQFVLDESYSIIYVNKVTKETYIQSDYLGLNTLFVDSYEDSCNIYSSLGIANTYRKLNINTDAIANHFGFGYHVKPHQYIYDINKLEGNILYQIKLGQLYKFKVYDNIETTCDEVLDDNKSLPYNLHSNIPESKRFYSLTAGKDSLTLLSAVNDKSSIVTGVFGEPESDDVLQAKIIAKQLNINNFIHITNCSSEEFEKYADYVSFFSGGLSTLSYVDMYKYVYNVVPENKVFMMGEAGECVRAFFNADTSILESMDSYITLQSALKYIYPPMNDDKYIEDLVNPCIEQHMNGSELDINFLLKFYRYYRMPGNFSLRHQILNPIIALGLPFTTSDFYKTYYNIDPKYFKESALHRRFIKQNAPSLLSYFDNPVKSKTSTQNWNERFNNGIIDCLYKMIEESDADLPFDKNKVLELLEQQRISPDRSIWLLLRVASLYIFPNSHKQLNLTKETITY